MKWIMIVALWNTPVPQDSFNFVTDTVSTKQECERNVQLLYKIAKENEMQAQGVCLSEIDLAISGKSL